MTYGVLLLVFLPAIRQRWRRPVLAIIAVIVVAVGFTRIASGVHYLTGVLAGWLLGAAWLAVTAAAFRHWRRDAGLATPPLLEGLAPEERNRLQAAPSAR